MKLSWKISCFKELSVNELYELLQLRNEVFIVEQNCVYQDVDGKDQKAWHLMGTFNDKIIAYARLFGAGDYFEEASIGRVVISPNFREKKIGHQLMIRAIAEIEKLFQEREITISAQLYLKRFYESHGFVVLGETYLEDDIPHIRMVRKS